MLYNDFKSLKIPALGFGGMRLPADSPAMEAPVKEKEAEEMLDYAMSHGVNYFDTAYGYHGGESERFFGKALKKYSRDSFFLADKFPGYEPRKEWDSPAVFEEQLERCGVEYFDFYMLHNVYENNIDTYFDDRWKIVEYLIEEKKKGRIKHLGFSTHGLLNTMKKFMNRYGEHMEFCQIQLNYMDWKLQNAKEKYEYLREINMPIWVMEPVRGGALADFSKEQEAAYKSQRPDESVAAWSFRFIQRLPGVVITLSGMSNMEQLKENIKTFEDNKPLTEKETQLAMKTSDSMLDMLPCTACKYCCGGCPQKLDIPTLLAYYNDHKFKGGFIAPMAVGGMSEDKRPTSCIECGKCTQVCPQNIDIPAALKDFSRLLSEAEF